jgi:hypothetical protein
MKDDDDCELPMKDDDDCEFPMKDTKAPDLSSAAPAVSTVVPEPVNDYGGSTNGSFSSHSGSASASAASMGSDLSTDYISFKSATEQESEFTSVSPAFVLPVAAAAACALAIVAVAAVIYKKRTHNKKEGEEDAKSTKDEEAV